MSRRQSEKFRLSYLLQVNVFVLCIRVKAVELIVMKKLMQERKTTQTSNIMI